MYRDSLASLKGKIALVTGGGTGIGLGITKAFLEAGARVIITGRRQTILDDAVASLGKNCHGRSFDMNQRKGIPLFIDSLENEFGALDILVNNAGAHLKKDALETTDEEFDYIMQINLASVFSMTRECVSRMKQRQSGAILLISSMTGLFGMEKVTPYGTSKTALIGMMHNMVTEFSAFNVRVNAIAPGWIQSDMLEKALDSDLERKTRIMNRIPYKSFGQPEDIGNAAVFLCSPAAGYITGVLLPVDGGAAYVL